MPANVQSHFTVRKPAWHDPTGKFDHDRPPADWDEARRWAGLDWEPERVPVYAIYDNEAPGAADENELVDGETLDDGRLAVPLTDFQLIRRSDNHRPLGVLSAGFELVTHRAMGEIMQALLDQPDVVYETAGALGEGEKVWALARVNRAYQVKGDASPTYPYVGLLNGHDGSSSLRAIRTQVRIVCQNTMDVAERRGDEEGLTFRFRHSKGIFDRIEAAREIILAVDAQAEAWKAQGDHLMSLRYRVAGSKDVETMFVANFIPAEPLITDRAMRNVEKAREQIREIIAGPTVEGSGVRGTAYGLAMAGTEYLDHYRRFRSRASYVSRTLLRPEAGKALAVEHALEAVRS